MFFYILAIILVILDQLSKLLITEYLILGQSIPIIKGIVNFTYVHNPGIAFGLLPGMNAIIIVLSIITLIILFNVYRKLEHESILLKLGIIFIFGGALGNLIDRLRWGLVVDFVDFQFWPIFNLADVFIVLGVGVIFIMLFCTQKKETENVSDSISTGTN